MLTADCRDSDANDSRWGEVALRLRLSQVLIATWAIALTKRLRRFLRKNIPLMVVAVEKQSPRKFCIFRVFRAFRGQLFGYALFRK
jgi:hypothetical protein